MSKKLFSKFIVLLLVVGLLFAVAPKQAFAQTADTSWYSEGPISFTLMDADDLAGLAQLVNAGNNFSGKTILLGADIDLSVYTNWDPIGGSWAEPTFRGVFDGQNHVISNLTSTRPDEEFVGLFGSVAGTIQNFTLTGVNVTGRNQVGGATGMLYPDGTANNVTVNNATINAKHWAGGIAGYVFGQLDNVHANTVTVILTFDTVANDNGDKGGGLIGYLSESTLSNCSATQVTVSGTRDVGGLVGAAGDTTISNCTVNGATVTSTNIDGNTLTPYTGGAVGRASHPLTITNVNVTNATLTSTPEGYTGLVVGGGSGPVTINNVKLVHGTTETFYATIQAAIDVAVTGDTIEVAAGTYNLTTAVQVDKEVTITGPTTGEATVIGVGGGSGTTTLPDKVFEITAPNVTIENLSLTLASMPGTYTGMISVPDSSGPGIIQGITISNNKMFLPQQSGAMGTWWGQGINLGRYVGGAVISGNEIYNTRSGIVVSYNSQVNITNNVIYNTKGGIMNYTGSLADAANRVMTGNSWGTVHNEWDIVWNTGGAPYDMDMNIYVLQVSQANNDAYVCSLMSTLVPQSTLTGNRSHVFAATTGTTTVRYDNGNINLPYAKIQDAIDAVVPGGKVIVAAGTYYGPVSINKSLTLQSTAGATTTIINGGATTASPTTGLYSVEIRASNVTFKGFTVTNPLWNGGIWGGDPTGIMIGYYGDNSLSNIRVTENIVTQIGDPTDTVEYNAPHGMVVNGVIAGLEIDHNVVHDLAAIVPENKGGTTGIGVYGYDDVNGPFSTNVSIHDNEVYDIRVTGNPLPRGIRIGYGADTATISTNNVHDLAGLGIQTNSYTHGLVAITGNIVTNTSVGISMEHAAGGTITNNTVSGSGTGIQLGAAVTGAPTITGNNVNMTYLQFHDGATAHGVTMTTVYAANTWAPYSIISGRDILVPGPVHNVTQDTYFDTIQAAINDAETTNGDIIEVRPGEYVETGQIVVSKSLTIRGIGTTPVIIKPAQNTGNSGDARGWWLVPSGVQFNLSNVTLDGAGKLVSIGILSHGTGTIENNIIKNIGYNPSGPDYAGRGIAFYDANMTIKNNLLQNIGRIGIYMYGTGVTNAVIDGNTYEGKGTGDWLDYGIEIEGGAVAEVKNNLIKNCLGIASVDGSGSAGLLITTYFAGGSTANIHDNTFSNNSVGLSVGYGGTDTSSVVAEKNKFLGNEVSVQSTNPLVDASPNWFGSACGPAVGSIYGNVIFDPWYTDEAMTTLVASGTYNFAAGTPTADINAAIACAANGSTFNFLPGDHNGNIVVPDIKERMTLVLKDGAHVLASSPCFDVSADFTTIKAEHIGMAACVTAAGSNGIDVVDGVVNLTVDGLEIYGPGNDGIHFNGVITDVVLRDNFIHNLAGNGVYFGAQPVVFDPVTNPDGIDIHGNLFQNNGGFGVTNPNGTAPIDATYNSWGDVAGPSAGDGVGPNVTATPFTHVDVYMVASGTPWTDIPLNQVVSGQQITFKVMAHVVNAEGVDIKLSYPSANLSITSSAVGGVFPTLENLDISTAGTIWYYGGRGSLAPITGTVELFTVTFTGGTPGLNLPMDLDELSDVFGMEGVGSSSNIYAVALLDSTVNVIALPVIDIVPVVPQPGPYTAGLPIEFDITVTNTGGGNFADLNLDFTLPTGAVLQYWDGDSWEAVVDPMTIGALATGGTAFDPILPLFRAIFLTPPTGVVSVALMDLAPATDFQLATTSETFTLLGDFTVTGTFSMQGRSTRAGIPVTLEYLDLVAYADKTGTTINQITYNLVIPEVNGGSWMLTTLQPRYLNVIIANNKIVSVDGNETLIALQLKGGNAVWTDNVINVTDASEVGTYYGTGTIADNADVNFDGKVNIQDLALVGGNFDLTSETAYGVGNSNIWLVQ